MKLLKKIIRLLPLTLPLFFLSCDIGLGEAVDLQAPEMELLSHKDNDTVATAFTLSGTASDNEGVTKIEIDFNEANLHYQITPGEEWKTKDASGNWQPADRGTCINEKGIWKWSVDVDCSTYISTLSANDRKSVKFTAVASDQAGNSGKKSKIDCTLVVDPSNPIVSVYKPELLTGDFKYVYDKVKDYQLQDGNILALLLNGSITIKGRQSDAVSFKALKVQLDSFAYDPNVSAYDRGTTASARYTAGSPVSSIDEIDSLTESSIGDALSSDVYFSKTIESSDLREWELTVKPEEWATNETGIAKGLNTGKHIIRVVTTSLTSSNKWEKKIVGYFVWWPEADRPWVTSAAGDDEEIPYLTECYPGSGFSGSAQDDDEIKSLVSTLYRKVGSEYVLYITDAEGFVNPIIHSLSSDSPKYASWTVTVPMESGIYKLVTTVKDESNEMSLTKYFKTSDVTAPRINIESPLDNTSAIVNAEGNLTFRLYATDNSKVASLAMVWLNPAKKTDPDNKIQYLTGESSEWNNATAAGYVDGSGNKIYLLGSGTSEISVEKNFNLYSDFGIDGNEKLLTSQEFIFRAVDDSDKKTVKAITLTGDGITPNVEFTDVKIGDDKKPFVNGVTTTAFKKIENGTKATVTGTWSDSFNSTLANTAKIKKLHLAWGDDSVYVDVKPDGTWTAEIQPPSSGGTITASLSDFGGNTKTVQAAASIETSDLQLTRIGCIEDDGAYTVGKTLQLTLEFSKNTDVSGGAPTLKLNNGGIAEYVSGSGSTSHVFKYTVGSSDSDTSKLTVIDINPNGAKWTDSAASTSSLTLSSASIPFKGNLEDTRSIEIDKTAPRIKSIEARTSNGSYKAGTSILMMLEFTEDVTIVNPGNLAIKLDHKNGTNDVKAGSPTVTGSKYVLFTYTVAAGENANPLTFSSVIHDNVIIKDNAGNELSVWSPVNSPSFTGIVIDTTPPSTPQIMDGTNQSNTWNPDRIIFDANGTSFIMKKTADIESMEYSFDGTNWTPYTSKVSLTNNGTYTVKARQTDKAGNVSTYTTVGPFTIDKGDLLTRITATTANGTYSTNTTTKSITGKIVFRKAVTIARGATVTLNVGNSNTNTTSKTCELSGSGTEYTFTYTIKDGDYVNDTDGLLDVTGWNFSSVKFDEYGIDVGVSFPASGTQKRFDKNREIKIVTGLPKIVSNGISFTGVGSGAVLDVTYDRDISKLSGNIVFEYDTQKAENEFHVPAVLSASEYNELKSNNAITSSYEAGTNGAVKSGTKLVNDTTTKYILKTTVSDTDSALVKVFTDAGKHKVTVPVISNQVSVVNGKTLRVALGSAYELPVKGAEYKLTIPAGAVTDAVSNKNAVFNGSVIAAGVEAPEIRIVKPRYKIYNKKEGNDKGELTSSNWVSTASAYVTMSEVQSVTMYLSCRTPRATIKYSTETHNSNSQRIKNSRPVDNSRNTGDASAPTSATTEYNTNGVSLGEAITDYTTATGKKIAIAAQAIKPGFTDSELSYEYATRTVVKLSITGGYRGGDDSYDKVPFNDVESGLILHGYRPWLMGGDSPSGPNSIDTFPLSWADTSKHQFMDGTYTSSDNMTGNWYWVSWDITSTTYIGFVIGDVPGDAVEKGPSHWIPADYHWVPMKSSYPLYPGEELIMAMDSNSTVPMGAALSFGIKKKDKR